MLYRLLQLSVLFAAIGAAEALPITKDIPRFQQVGDGFYRGGQPVRDGFNFLKQQGIKMRWWFMGLKQQLYGFSPSSTLPNRVPQFN